MYVYVLLGRGGRQEMGGVIRWEKYKLPVDFGKRENLFSTQKETKKGKTQTKRIESEE